MACERDPHQSGWWIPEESCEAVIPVCSNIAGESEATLACIAYPAGDLKKDTNFEGGALSVSELKGPDTERKCQSVLDLSHTAFHRETINGARFDVTEMDGAATGSREDRRVYRNFHKGKCYELDIVITSSDMYEPGTVKKFDSEKVRGALNTILESFEFLK
ncbi:MAG TPA: hypothetical protein VEF05_00685 [Terriglobales bacterium]|nr:hypothetical protein [Terriglobales bacterium]